MGFTSSFCRGRGKRGGRDNGDALRVGQEGAELFRMNHATSPAQFWRALWAASGARLARVPGKRREGGAVLRFSLQWGQSGPWVQFPARMRNGVIAGSGGVLSYLHSKTF